MTYNLDYLLYEKALIDDRQWPGVERLSAAATICDLARRLL
jgi:hypothetical protein